MHKFKGVTSFDKNLHAKYSILDYLAISTEIA